ncbi:hypothetical protein ACQKPX_16315 [Photobacterium sp. DNB23_23_1]|uniref:Uncharacterized protein n=1 Tax=Photobacterium pectinilyticum TaxID=2906793 RepID=A0ABT1MZQ3_9GAMM|nr:hypothetical protein [Photobacterium sp. ZSDE20]MCQ1057955.1 hypothetical protein [Photobacterium sp. ZSDE20]MDD1822487.1 hypothetical protein [Photobacterium sp. ZSDE20]
MQEMKADIDKFMAQRPLEGAILSKDISQDIQRKVREEVDSAEQSSLVVTDHNDHTNGMLSVIRDPIEHMGRWVAELNGLQARLRKHMDESSLTAKDTEHQQVCNTKAGELSKKELAYIQENGYQDAKDELEKSKKLYDKMFNAAGGKPPKKVNAAVYAMGLLVPSVPEFWMNYETLGTLLNIPLFALALAFVSATVTAAAAHFHGKFLKQRLELLGPDIEPREKRQHYRVQFFAWIAFISITVGILAVRYQAIARELAETVIWDTGAPAESAFTILFPFIIFAIAPWFISMFCAYALNDAKPSYQEAQKNFHQARAHFNRLDKGMQKELQQVERKYARQIEELANAQEAERNEMQKIERLQDILATHADGVMVQAQKEINRNLQTYHNNLVMQLRAKNMEDVKIGAEMLDLQTYYKRDIKISKEQLLGMVA